MYSTNLLSLIALLTTRFALVIAVPAQIDKPQQIAISVHADLDYTPPHPKALEDVVVVEVAITTNTDQAPPPPLSAASAFKDLDENIVYNFSVVVTRSDRSAAPISLPYGFARSVDHTKEQK